MTDLGIFKKIYQFERFTTIVYGISYTVYDIPYMIYRISLTVKA